MNQKYRIAAAGYAALLLAYTGYVLLHTFVLASPAQTGANEMNLAMFANETTKAVSTAAESTAQTTETAAQTDAPDTEITTASALEAGKPVPIGTAASAVQTETDAPETDAPQTEQITAQTVTELQTEPETEETLSETAPAVEYIRSDTMYQDENICISIQEYNAEDTVIYVADVTLSSAQYLKTAFADDTFGQNVTAHTSEIAAAHDAVLAVNGDFYGARESGYVIRNGVLYREQGNPDADVLCIMADGSFFITNSNEYTAQDLLDMGAWQAFSFGPALLQDGGITVDAQTEVGRAMASNPRTALGIISGLHYVFVVSDGRTSESAGLSLYQLAGFMQGLGVQTAYNLDGGGSSTMYFNGAVINNPTTSGRSIKERSVSDIVYIGY